MKFEKGCVIISGDGMIPTIEPVETPVTAEKVRELRTRFGFTDRRKKSPPTGIKSSQ